MMLLGDLDDEPRRPLDYEKARPIWKLYELNYETEAWSWMPGWKRLNESYLYQANSIPLVLYRHQPLYPQLI